MEEKKTYQVLLITGTKVKYPHFLLSSLIEKLRATASAVLFV